MRNQLVSRFGKKLGYDDDVFFFFLPAKEGTFKFESTSKIPKDADIQLFCSFPMSFIGSMFWLKISQLRIVGIYIYIHQNVLETYDQFIFVLTICLPFTNFRHPDSTDHWTRICLIGGGGDLFVQNPSKGVGILMVFRACLGSSLDHRFDHHFLCGRGCEWQTCFFL